MKKLLCLSLTLLLIAGVIGLSSAAVLTFEGLDDHAAVPNGYGGFNWNAQTQIGTVNGTDYWPPGTGYYYGRVSGDMVAYNFWGLSPSEITLATPGTFTFIGAYFTSAWVPQQITLEGYKDSSLLYRAGPYDLVTTGPIHVVLNWSGINRLVIYNTQWQWVMDDFTYQVVPLPSAILLFGSGVLGIAGLRRKFFG